MSNRPGCEQCIMVHGVTVPSCWELLHSPRTLKTALFLLFSLFLQRLNLLDRRLVVCVPREER